MAQSSDDLRRAVIAARDPDEAARAYQSLFGRVTPARLEELRRDENAGIALQAAWKERASFLGFLRGRIAVDVPSWWEHTMAGAIHGRTSFFPPSNAYRYRETGLGLFAPDGTSVQQRDAAAIVVTSSGRSLRTSSGVVAKAIERARAQGGADQISVDVGAVRAYLAVHPSAGFPYTLTCLHATSGQVIWEADVWATGRKTLEGQGYHKVTLSERDGSVVVFGVESHGMYVEGFAAETGKNLFRFCTCRTPD